MAKGEYSCSENVVHEGAVAEVREKMHDGAALTRWRVSSRSWGTGRECE